MARPTPTATKIFEFHRLVDADWVTTGERLMIADLMAATTVSTEAKWAPVPQHVATWLLAQMKHFDAIGAKLPVSAQAHSGELDAFVSRDFVLA